MNGQDNKEVSTLLSAEREEIAKMLEARAEDSEVRAERWRARGVDHMAQAKEQAATELREAANAVRERKLYPLTPRSTS